MAIHTAKLEEPLLLVLDDYQVLNTRGIRKSTSGAIVHLPKQSNMPDDATVLVGRLRDHAAWYGVLNSVRDLGFVLLSFESCEGDEA